MGHCSFAPYSGTSDAFAKHLDALRSEVAGVGAAFVDGYAQVTFDDGGAFGVLLTGESDVDTALSFERHRATEMSVDAIFRFCRAGHLAYCDPDDEPVRWFVMNPEDVPNARERFDVDEPELLAAGAELYEALGFSGRS